MAVQPCIFPYIFRVAFHSKKDTYNDPNHTISQYSVFFRIQHIPSEKAQVTSSTNIEMQYRKGAAVAISSSLHKCINKSWKVYKALAVHNNSLWHYGYSFVDGRRNKVSAQTNFSTCTLLKKG